MPNVLGEGPPERVARRGPASVAGRRSLSTGGLGRGSCAEHVVNVDGEADKPNGDTKSHDVITNGG